MAGYIVVGNAAAKKNTIETALDELKAGAEKDGGEFWLVLPLSETPEGSIDRVLTWAVSKEIWFTAFTKKSVEIEEDVIEAVAEEIKDARDPVASALKRCNEEEDFEGALVLFDEDDEELGDFLGEQLFEKGVRTFLGLNIGLEPLDLSDEDAPAEPEPEEDEKPRTRSKKAEPKDEAKPRRAAKADEPEDEPEVADEPAGLDADELASKRITSLRKLYTQAGLGDPGDMEKADLIAALVSGKPGSTVTINVEATQAPSTAGYGSVLAVFHLPKGVHTAVVTADAARAFLDAHGGQ